MIPSGKAFRQPPETGTLQGNSDNKIMIGRFTEWLGGGLQNHLRRFESATDLNPTKTP